MCNFRRQNQPWEPSWIVGVPCTTTPTNWLCPPAASVKSSRSAMRQRFLSIKKSVIWELSKLASRRRPGVNGWHRKQWTRQHSRLRHRALVGSVKISRIGQHSNNPLQQTKGQTEAGTCVKWGESWSREEAWKPGVGIEASGAWTR